MMMNRHNWLHVAIVMVLGMGWLGALWTAVAPAHAAPATQAASRLVIKQGTIDVEVMDTETAVATAQSLIGFNSYVLEQRIWDDDAGYRYATLTFGIPAAQFEETVRQFRTLGIVLDESGSGQDVTDQVVDLESQLDNLYATQTRMRTYLEQATNITETFRVNDELTQIEAEIGELQGQANYLRDRAAVATLTLRLFPFIPTPTPQPTQTPTPTPTATPLPAPESWQPAETAKVAAVRLQNNAQSTADFLIYRSIVCVPWLVVLGGLVMVGWLVRRWWRLRTTAS